MSWFKLDDRIFDNPKIAALSDRAKVAYLESGTYCARELTDGFVPLNKAKAIAGTTRALKELVPGLWEPVAGGYRIHDYLDYNPTREKVLADKAALSKRRSEAGSKGAAVRWQTDGKEDGKSLASDMAPLPVTPSIPDPVSQNPLPADPEPSAALAEWVTRLGRLSKADEAELLDFERLLPWEWIQEAIEETDAKSTESPWPYCRTILIRCTETKQSPRGRRTPNAPAGSARAQFLSRYRNLQGVSA